MNIVGHGVDLVEVDRIAALLQAHSARFLARVFTPGEQAYAQGRRSAAQHFAARFAAKEAVLKALGTGWSGGIAWTDVEVTAEPTGRPTIILHGLAKCAADDLTIFRWHLSLTHTPTWAMASVIACGM